MIPRLAAADRSKTIRDGRLQCSLHGWPWCDGPRLDWFGRSARKNRHRQVTDGRHAKRLAILGCRATDRRAACRRPEKISDTRLGPQFQPLAGFGILCVGVRDQAARSAQPSAPHGFQRWPHRAPWLPPSDRHPAHRLPARSLFHGTQFLCRVRLSIFQSSAFPFALNRFKQAIDESPPPNFRNGQNPPLRSSRTSFMLSPAATSCSPAQTQQPDAASPRRPLRYPQSWRQCPTSLAAAPDNRAVFAEPRRKSACASRAPRLDTVQPPLLI